MCAVCHLRHVGAAIARAAPPCLHQSPGGVCVFGTSIVPWHVDTNVERCELHACVLEVDNRLLDYSQVTLPCSDMLIHLSFSKLHYHMLLLLRICLYNCQGIHSFFRFYRISKLAIFLCYLPMTPSTTPDAFESMCRSRLRIPEKRLIPVTKPVVRLMRTTGLVRHIRQIQLSRL
jgi:hypothetical protein